MSLLQGRELPRKDAGPAARLRSSLGGRVWNLRRLISPLVLVGIWAVVTYSGSVDTRLLPAPGQALDAAIDMISRGELISDLFVSLRRVALGLLIGTVVGLALAIVGGLWRLGDDLIDPLVQIVRSFPILAISPLLTIWLGLYEAPKITIIALAAAFPVYLNVLGAIRGVDRDLVEMGTVFGLRGAQLVRRVILPATLPAFLTSLRFSLTICWIALIFAEQINAQSGLGHLTNRALSLVRTDMLIVLLVVYAILALAADAVVRYAERKLLFWRKGFQGR